MAAKKTGTETLTIDRSVLAQAITSKGRKVGRKEATRIADLMAEAARADLMKQGVEVFVRGRRFTALRDARLHGEKREQEGDSGRKKTGPKGTYDNPLVLKGDGLQAPISEEEGLRRLRKHMVQISMEEWAGPVLGPQKAAKALGVSRSTLDNWRKKEEIIALPKGKTTHVIPMEQFTEGRPVPGIDRVLQIAHGSATIAWTWLMTPHIDFDGEPPLRALSEGRGEDVFEAAEWSIG